MPIPTKPAEPRRLYQHVADRIRSLIQEGRFDVGARLPPERDLAAQLGVSRPSLREALIALEIEGCVEIRMGSGVYVCAPPEAPWVARSLGESPTELMQARAALEGCVASMAAARATPAALARIRDCLDAMQADVTRRQAPVRNDRRFHFAIAEMAGNAVLTRLVGELFDERHGPIAARLRARSERPATWRIALQEHEQLVKALEALDPLAAAAAMHAHLSASAERWTED